MTKVEMSIYCAHPSEQFQLSGLNDAICNIKWRDRQTRHVSASPLLGKEATQLYPWETKVLQGRGEWVAGWLFPTPPSLSSSHFVSVPPSLSLLSLSCFSFPLTPATEEGHELQGILLEAGKPRLNMWRYTCWATGMPSVSNLAPKKADWGQVWL